MKNRYLLYAAVVMAGMYFLGNFAFDRIEARLAQPVTFTCVIPRELPKDIQGMFQLEDTATKWNGGLEKGVFMASQMNGWTPLDENYRMARQDTWIYTLTVSPPPGDLEYKYTFFQKDKNGDHIVWIPDFLNSDNVSSGVWYGSSLNSIYHRKTVLPYQTFFNTSFHFLFIILLVLLISGRAISFIFGRKMSLKYKLYFSFTFTSLIVLGFAFFMFVNQIVDQIRINWVSQTKLLYRALETEGNGIARIKERSRGKPIFLPTLFDNAGAQNVLLNYVIDPANLHATEMNLYYLIDDRANLIAAGATRLGGNNLETEQAKIAAFLDGCPNDSEDIKDMYSGHPHEILFFNGSGYSDQSPLMSRYGAIKADYNFWGPRKLFLWMRQQNVELYYLFHPYNFVYMPIIENRICSGAIVAMYDPLVAAGYLHARINYFLFTSISILIAILILSVILIDPILQIIVKLTGRFEEVSRGEYGNKITIATRDELQSMGEAFNSMLDGLRAKQQLLHYVSKSAWETAHKRAAVGDETLTGESKIVTLLFSDIKGFTPLSNRYSAKEVVEILNEYFDEMTKIIARHNGQIDKFIGDAIMAVFDGADTADCCGHAVQSAIEMQKFLKDRVLANKEAIQIRIGINTGQVIMGDIGSLESRRDYTCIGDNVNKTQRLESMCSPGCVLLSQATHKLISNHVHAEKMELKIKGFDEKVDAYEIQKLEWR